MGGCQRKPALLTAAERSAELRHFAATLKEQQLFQASKYQEALRLIANDTAGTEALMQAGLDVAKDGLLFYAQLVEDAWNPAYHDDHGHFHDDDPTLSSWAMFKAMHAGSAARLCDVVAQCIRGALGSGPGSIMAELEEAQGSIANKSDGYLGCDGPKGYDGYVLGVTQASKC